MTEQNVITTLNEFVDVALRNRKYSPNTAYGYRAALRVFADELSPEELQSFELFKERFEQIFSALVNKKQKEFSISSLQAYKHRIQYILRDYEKYGIDPSKMTNWVPSKSKPHIFKQKQGSPIETIDSRTSGGPNDGGSGEFYPVELPSGIKVEFPKSMSYNVVVGDFSAEIKGLNKKAEEISKGTESKEDKP